MKAIKKCLRKLALVWYFILTKVMPVSGNVIVWESNVGRNYSGNVRSIYEYMVSRGLDKRYKMVWSLENLDTVIPGKAVKVKRTHFKYLYYMSVARVWVSDSRMPAWLIKREGNTYIQTWHGTPLKKLALDMNVLSMGGKSDIEKYHEEFAANTKTWDYLISQNAFSTETFRRCFAFKGEMLEIGYPRNDILFTGNNKEYIDKLKRKLNLPLDKKVILYAPTWRDDQYYHDSFYKFTSDMNYDLMKKKLLEEYVLIVKFHYLVKDHMDWSSYDKFIFEFNEQQDISELYLVSDILITDYSSVMFDYSLLKRPMFFFAYDLDNYRDNLRGFYFDFLKTAPGPVVRTTEELTEAILSYDKEDWQKQYDAFSRTYNHADDGNASCKVAQIIEGRMR